MATRRSTKQLDKFIETVFYRHFSGVAVRLLDIPKIYAAGRSAAVEGRDIEAAVIVAGQLAHEAADPHCTCNTCHEAFTARMEAN